MMSSSESSRRRKKDPDRERTSPKSKDRDREEKKKERHKSSKVSGSSRKSRSSTSKNDDRDRERERRRSRERSTKERKDRSRTPSSTSQTPTKSHRMAIVPEMERRGSLGSPRNGSRSSLSSYPTLSKTHAKENIYAREEGIERRKSPITPEATDVGDSPDHEKSKSAPAPPTRAPPSPPLTATTGADLRKTASANSMKRRKSESLYKEMEPGRRSVDSGTRLTPEPRFSASRSSMREDLDVDETDLTSTTVSSQPSTVKMAGKPSTPVQTKARSSKTADSRTTPRASPAPRPRSRQESEITQSTDSDATSVARGHESARRQSEGSPYGGDSPASVVDSSPRTPTQHSAIPSVLSAQKDGPPPIEVMVDPISRTQSVNSTYTDVNMPPPPPPPPPPMMVVMNPPRVDYLLMNGGLQRPTTRGLLGGANGQPATAYNAYASPRVGASLDHEARAFFRPLQQVLDSYNAVIDKSGSVAVATGYRSVARRLLDRLEAVFARNISSEYCDCIMCAEHFTPTPTEDSLSPGINWGEILEFVSGRRELPAWPPVNPTSTGGLGISELEDPCQRIDVDVPEEYRKYYAKQSQKTKASVQDWLSEQQDISPEEADDDTLTFAMLTRLEQSQRPLFYALLYGMDHIPTPRSQPVTTNGTTPTIAKAASAIQRLYRLPVPPRDQLVVMYLIQNPEMHSILATLAAVKRQEWEILISGRFDGFLWSGAEDVDLNSPLPPSRQPSRNSQYMSTSSGVPVDADGPQRFASPMGHRPYTPYSSAPSPRPGSTRPGSGPAPVQVDEDTEIAVLAEVERDIFLAMEAMENAFEDLHNQAELVRRRLRERYSALSAASQARSQLGGIEVRGATPGPFRPDLDADSLDDLRSEIGPDDSASNVSHNRRGRGHRSKARRTPAPVEEETEEQIASLAERIRRRL